MKNKKQTLSITAILFLVATNFVSAQDLVVTSKNDSINAKITKIKKGMLHFNFVKDGEVRKTLLPLTSVKVHKKNFFLESEVPENYKPKNSYSGSRYRVAIQGGLSYLTAKTASSVPQALKNHVKQLKSGYHWGAEIHYFTNENFGFGLKYSTFYSSNSEQNVSITLIDNSVLYGIKDTNYIHFIGPSVLYKTISSNGKNAWTSGLSLGYLGYKQKEQAGNRYFTSTAATFGMSADLGYDIYLYKKLSLGFLVSFVSGSLGEIDVENNGVSQTIKLDERESLGRIDLSVGLRWNL
jgi:hypothetical protein